jgi:hypothetical protein
MMTKSKPRSTAFLSGSTALCAGCVRTSAALATSGAARSDASAEFKRQFGAAFLDRYWHLHPDSANAR